MASKQRQDAFLPARATFYSYPLLPPTQRELRLLRNEESGSVRGVTVRIRMGNPERGTDSIRLVGLESSRSFLESGSADSFQSERHFTTDHYTNSDRSH
ncbi:hypothetical protein AVEN_188330-1 [Araneus ventricosus]|uniref:Uncharacterized protein n=1 Tax=Araneus ventricosus TaxID=182803 RepID=A0A4Y2MJQ2_ARAVE|nr:hypothetical protein AVEN_188330-1 [Araneus ventricosus]